MSKTTGNEQKKHAIRMVLPGSIAAETGIESGDFLLSVDGQEITDLFDYQYLTQEEKLTLLVEKADGELWELEIEKDAEEDLGIVFETGLMDSYRRCSNRCIFCFIDQMPPGMRETLYFKDDDARLSFLQGNYITLTNLSDRDLERIIKYRMSPVNVSVHTMNPELRCRMLGNRFAGEALKKLDILRDAGISMNAQIVLCKGYNDGEELKDSLRKLSGYQPCMESVSVVPVGLSRFREGLTPLEPFTPEDAREVIGIIEELQEKSMSEHGCHFVHASDEWYLNAGLPLPEAERYDGYLQLDNGVGMVRRMLDEFAAALEKEQAMRGSAHARTPRGRNITLATGMLIGPVIADMARQIEEEWPQIRICVRPIRNDFFGEQITVSGLLTGQDLRAQLSGTDLGELVYLPENVLRSGEEVFLDDMTRSELADALQVRVVTVKLSGYDFLETILYGE
ncbi:MAG: DUF512 domain-containing protein [Lachnospiraceae bacterium]|nr:DUF512 domain-containing protein [Lachnospiraceae bacterium]